MNVIKAETFAAVRAHDPDQFSRFLARLQGSGIATGDPAFLSSRFAFAYYTDDRERLEAAHAAQRERRARDPSWRKGKSATFDPAARRFERCWLTPDEAWHDALARNVPGSAVGITVRISECDGRGAKRANFTHPRALVVDADTRAGGDGLRAFVKRTGLTPSMIVCSSTVADSSHPSGVLHKVHAYWVLASTCRPAVPWENWEAAQQALSESCRTDASLTDPPQAMRVPGSLNLKDPSTPSLVRLLHDSGPDYEFADFVARAGFSAAPRPARLKARSLASTSNFPRITASPPRGMAERIAAGSTFAANFNAGITAEVLHESVDVRAAAQVCPAIAEAFASGGANHSEPLWFTMLGLAVFDHQPLACALAMSHAHPDFTPEATEAKLAQAREGKRAQDIGWTSCAAIARHHPACATCYYRTGTTGPLTIYSRTTRGRLGT